MKVKQLFKALSVIDGISISKWNVVTDIVEAIKRGKVTIVNSSWASSFDQRFRKELDLSDIRTWSTYEGECVSLSFNVEKSELVCIAKIYNGDTLNGRRKDLRFIAKLIMPSTFILKIGDAISFSLTRWLEKEYESYLERQKEEWMQKLWANILTC